MKPAMPLIPSPRFSPGRRLAPALLLLAAVVSGCAADALQRAPAAPDRPWRPAVSQVSGPVEAETAVEGFGVVVPEAAISAPQAPAIDLSSTYGLPALIDIAQRLNPETRQAWNRAREAALAVGMLEASFLPMLSANVIAGYQRTSTPSPLVIDGQRNIDTDLSAVIPALALEWLVFDFGQREALLEGAEQLSYAANVLFNASHQKVIRDVTSQFHQYNAARQRKALASQALANHQRVARAVQERLDAGVATTLERAVARQGVAQARLHQVNAEAEERNTYLALLASVGLPPTAALKVSQPERMRLPSASDPVTDDAVRRALSRRPDIAAGYAAMKAADAAVAAAEADFMPKVYLGAVAARSRSNFDIRGLPQINQQVTTGGVLLGVSVPLYDGGLRRARLMQEQERADQAGQNWQQVQRDATREIIAADSVLRAALQSHEAATSLVGTAQTAYDAALDAYREGAGTITLATEAATDLLESRLAQSDAYAAAQVAAANLAFVTGRMASGQDHWLPTPLSSRGTHD